MNVRTVILVGALGLLGFLFYPRDAAHVPIHQDTEWIETISHVPGEPLRSPPMYRTDPVVETYDLGFIYQVDRARVVFKNPATKGPRRYSIFGSTQRSGTYRPIFSYHGYSSTYTEGVYPFHEPTEVRWIQVVVSDWVNEKPKMEVKDFRVGARYERPGPIQDIQVNFNPAESYLLTDGLLDRVWKGGRSQKTEKDGQYLYLPPEKGKDVLIRLDLGSIQTVYGIRLTCKDLSSNLKSYTVSLHTPERRNIHQATVSPPEDDQVSLHTLSSPARARFVELLIPFGQWSGDYPQIREIEVFTDTYRLPPGGLPQIENYSAVQAYYENAGYQNQFAPNLTQGFPYDRGDTTDEPDRFFWREDRIAPGTSDAKRSFAYHPHELIFQYTQLDPAALYWVRVTYLQEKEGQRVQRLTIGGYIAHDSIRPDQLGSIPPAETGDSDGSATIVNTEPWFVGQGKPEQLTFAVPQDAYADGTLDIRITRLRGPNAVVSELSLFEGRQTGVSDMAAEEGRHTGRAIRAATPPTIDGSLDEWPLLYPVVSHDGSSQVYLQWDQEALYLGAKIDRRSSQGANTYLDRLHLFIDATFQRSPGMYTHGDHHLVFSPSGVSKGVRVGQIHHHMDALQASLLDIPDVEAIRNEYASGYLLEARIPAGSVLRDFVPEAGQEIGFNYILANQQTGSTYWVTSNPNAPPARWGRIRLLSSVEGKVALLDPLTSMELTQFNAGDTLIVVVRDPDRNTDPNQPETVTVEVSGTSTGDHRTLTLYETELTLITDEDTDNGLVNDSELFAARLPTVYGTELAVQDPTSSVPHPLVVRGGETVTLRYTDPYFSSTQRDYDVSYQAKVRTGTTGTLDVLNSQEDPLEDTAEIGSTGTLTLVNGNGEPLKTFRAKDNLVFVVRDEDLIQVERLREPPPEGEQQSADQQVPETSSQEGNETPKADAQPSLTVPTITVHVVVEQSEEREEVILEYIPETGSYRGSLLTDYAEEPVPNDGTLQVKGTQQIVATYLDRLQSTGRTNAPVTKRALVLTGETATLSIQSVPGMIIKGGQKYFNAGDSLKIQLKDGDVNQDPSIIDQVTVQTMGDIGQDALVMTLLETSEDSGIFSGVLLTQYAVESVEDTILQVAGGEKVTITYIDALQGTGATQVPVQDSVVVNVGVDGTFAIVHANFTDLESLNAGDTIYFSATDEDEVGREIVIHVEGQTLHDTVEVVLLRSTVGSYTAPLQTVYAETAIADDGILQVQGDEEVIAVYTDRLRSSGETNIAVEDRCRINTGTTGKLAVFSAREPGTLIGQFAAGESLRIQVSDLDLNINSRKIETTFAVAEFFVTGSLDDIPRERMQITLQEISGNAGVFEGILETAYGETSIPNDTVLQVQGYGAISITYTDAIQETGRTQVPIATILSVRTGQTGVLELRKTDDSAPLSSLSAGDRVLIRLNDNDLNWQSGKRDVAEILAQGNVLDDQVDVLLLETEPDSGVFWGYLETQDASQDRAAVDYEDDLLQIRDKEVISVIYLDALGSSGKPNQPVEAKLLVASSSAGILLIVDEVGEEIGELRAGQSIYFHLEDLLLTTAQGQTEVSISVSGNRTNDFVPVELDRVPGEEGVFEGVIATRYGTTPTYDDVLDVQGGETVQATYRPEFLGIQDLEVTDTAYVSRGNRGRLLITRSDGNKLYHFTPGARLHFRLEDPDLNEDPFSVEWADIRVGTEVSEILKRVALKEIAPDAGVFIGSLATEFGRSTESLGLIGGETIQATYRDALIDTGETNFLITDTCVVNAVGYASFASEPIVIDGINNKWDLSSPLTTANEEALVWVAWDANNLYIFAQIEDSDVRVEDPTRWYENADALEIHLDLEAADQERPSYIPSTSKPYLFWFCPRGAGPDGQRAYAGRASPTRVWNYAPPLQIAKRFRSSYYVMEIAIPFAILETSEGQSFDPQKSSRFRRIGFNFIVYRSDGPQLQWAQAAGLEAVTPPSQLGTLYLREPRTED